MCTQTQSDNYSCKTSTPTHTRTYTHNTQRTPQLEGLLQQLHPQEEPKVASAASAAARGAFAGAGTIAVATATNAVTAVISSSSSSSRPSSSIAMYNCACRRWAAAVLASLCGFRAPQKGEQGWPLGRQASCFCSTAPAAGTPIVVSEGAYRAWAAAFCRTLIKARFYVMLTWVNRVALK